MSNLNEAIGRTTKAPALTKDDVLALIEQNTRFRTGIGYDVHRFVEGRPLVLGGVVIPYSLGLLGHSDADVVVHAAIDAILGAAGCSDIGTYFPDDEEAYKGADSIVLARRVRTIVTDKGFQIQGIDLMVVAEAPKLKPHVPSMKIKIAEAFGLDLSQVGLKATTNESMGWIGRGEGIACLASALVRVLPNH